MFFSSRNNSLQVHANLAKLEGPMKASTIIWSVWRVPRLAWCPQICFEMKSISNLQTVLLKSPTCTKLFSMGFASDSPAPDFVQSLSQLRSLLLPANRWESSVQQNGIAGLLWLRCWHCFLLPHCFHCLRLQNLACDLSVSYNTTKESFLQLADRVPWSIGSSVAMSYLVWKYAATTCNVLFGQQRTVMINWWHI